MSLAKVALFIGVIAFALAVGYNYLLDLKIKRLSMKTNKSIE